MLQQQQQQQLCLMPAAQGVQALGQQPQKSMTVCAWPMLTAMGWSWVVRCVPCLLPPVAACAAALQAWKTWLQSHCQW